MDLLSMTAAGGLWPALPLSGYWLLTPHNLKPKVQFFPFISFAALMTVAGMALWSLPMLTAAATGFYRAEYFGLLGWFFTGVSLWLLFKQHSRFTLSYKFTFWDWVLAVGLIVAAGLYLGFPTESILGGRDQGVYANHGIHIANHGRLDVPYPWPENVSNIFASNFSEFPGFYKTQPRMTVQFAHLFPVWLAQVFSTFGYHGLFRLNGIFALLSLSIFYGLCRFALPKSYAAIATLFLALNPSEIWLARITLTEILTQLFILSGIWLLLLALEKNSNFLARWAGIFLGFSALVRIDSFFLVPLLFLSHLALRIFEKSDTKRHDLIWFSLYQTALSVFSLAVYYYAFYSTPYFYSVSSLLARLGIAALVALLALLAVTPKILRLVRLWFTNKTFRVLICLVVIGLTAYAYWIRPSFIPYAITNWLWHPLDSTRNYRDFSLVSLAQYLSPLVIWMGVLGWLVTLLILVHQRRHQPLAISLVVFGGFATLYLWNPSVDPDHFWAIRRFVPVIIPGFIFFAALGIQWIAAKFSKSRAITVLALIIVFLSGFTFKANALILTFSENKGMFMQLQQLADKLPVNTTTILHGSSYWTTPLYIAFNRQVVPLDLTTDRGRAAFNRWINKQISEHKPVYLLFEGNLRFSGLQISQMDEIFLSWLYSERTVNPLPKKILREDIKISFSKITDVVDVSDYLNINLGSEPVWGVQESGFHGQELRGDKPVRWTTGTAKLVVPLNEQRLPKVLRVELEATSPKGTKLSILVNGRELFNEQVYSGSWSTTLSLADVALGKQATIKLLSATWIPKETIAGSEDSRTLGVSVKGIKLLADG